ncbi:LysE family translocator [Acidipropionibacterium timonense]|uniref:LysE family translocator n=1 Tax=Acidipropionibacterium timonense TaxID=2161818 RepID=UPI001AEBE6C2|nr:LysE family translocator [Acidipropionibacterium timonense]
MTVTHALVQFALVAGLLTLTPGIDTALVLRQALTRSRGVAMLTAVGIGTGCLLWGIAAAIGTSALVTASQLAYGVVKLAGALYLLWMGVQMLWHAIRGDHADLGTTGSTATSAHAAFLKGLLTNVLNPKIGVFYVAVLPQFLPHGVSPLAMGLLWRGSTSSRGSSGSAPSSLPPTGCEPSSAGDAPTASSTRSPGRCSSGSAPTSP